MKQTMQTNNTKQGENAREITISVKLPEIKMTQKVGIGCIVVVLFCFYQRNCKCLFEKLAMH